MFLHTSWRLRRLQKRTFCTPERSGHNDRVTEFHSFFSIKVFKTVQVSTRQVNVGRTAACFTTIRR